MSGIYSETLLVRSWLRRRPLLFNYFFDLEVVEVVDMPRPLSLDLRKRVIETHQEKKLTIQQVAALFLIGTATVKRWIAMFRKTNSLAPKPYTGCNPPKIPSENFEIVEKLIKEKPDITLSELSSSYEDITGIKVSTSAMDRTLKRMGVTRKKKHFMQMNERVNA